jgi:hypothetical protein
MRASTHERTIQADADEPANPTGTDLPSLSAFVAVLLCEGSAPCPDAKAATTSPSRCSQSGVLSVCQTVFTSGRESANHSIRQSQHLRCVQTRVTSVDAHSVALRSCSCRSCAPGHRRAREPPQVARAMKHVLPNQIRLCAIGPAGPPVTARAVALRPPSLSLIDTWGEPTASRRSACEFGGARRVPCSVCTRAMCIRAWSLCKRAHTC